MIVAALIFLSFSFLALFVGVGLMCFEICTAPKPWDGNKEKMP